MELLLWFTIFFLLRCCSSMGFIDIYTLSFTVSIAAVFCFVCVFICVYICVCVCVCVCVCMCPLETVKWSIPYFNYLFLSLSLSLSFFCVELGVGLDLFDCRCVLQIKSGLLAWIQLYTLNIAWICISILHASVHMLYAHIKW